jgi:ATP-dependent helicase/nuclease subunit A
MLIQDEKQRELAIDVHQSFIVQAPAGSGKTELLTQRCLALLGNAVHDPEEILAITFTRKAASEMRDRIINALKKAKKSPKPQEAHQAKTYDLAKKVLEKDAFYQWRLLENPNRLKITTIDAFCRSIVSRLPILSKMGSEKNIIENAYDLYQQAARATLGHLKKESQWLDAIKELLSCVDNDYERAEKLIIDMLKTRDQWLEYLYFSEDLVIEQLETSLSNVIQNTLEKTYSYLIEHIDIDELLPLIRYASQHQLSNPFEYDELPEPESHHIVFWHFLAKISLTQEGTVRKMLIHTDGFPAPSNIKNKEEKQLATLMKKNMLNLLRKIEQHPELINLLNDIQSLPPRSYYQDAAKKNKIFSLFELLKLAYAELKLLFRMYNKVDFTEVAICASSALKNTLEVSDIHLILDYQLKHILIDEFQDTSRLQFSLLENLTQEWMPDGDKTVFLVGDPMQSIYKFRQAEVGLFLQVKNNGLNHLNIIPLTLTCNFRSEKPIIDWINTQFSTAFPEKNDIASGAITFSPSIAIKQNLTEKVVEWHPISSEIGMDHQTLSIIKTLHVLTEKNPDASIAILGRKRKHLMAIMQGLNAFKIPYQAIEIESLIEKPIIQDLIALTCALHHLGDNIAWLAVLRMPCIGLSLPDLLVISEHLPQKTVFDILHDAAHIVRLSDRAQKILARIVPQLNFAIHERKRFSLRQFIEETWIALGAQALLKTTHEQLEVNYFLDFLDHWQPELIDIYTLKHALNNKFSTISHQSASIQLMTIHKSKGLEFDYVILPALQEAGLSDAENILAWHEQPRQHATQFNHYDWLLAPKKAIGDDKDKMYYFIRMMNQKKSHYEITRLFYVGATRAKKGLHLFYEVLSEEKKSPPKDSLMASVFQNFQSIDICIHHPAKEKHPLEIPVLNTPNLPNILTNTYAVISEDWFIPENIYSHGSSSISDNEGWVFEFDWHLEQKIGSVYHALLKLLSENIESQSEDTLTNLKTKIQYLFYDHYIPLAHHEYYLQQIFQDILNMLKDPTGRWILNPNHEDAKSEYPITCILHQQIKHFIIDRTFIDEKGTRWVIDYKTTSLNLQNEADLSKNIWHQHENQLNNYAKFFTRLSKNPIKLGLYFPRAQLFFHKTYQETHDYVIKLNT